MDKYVSYEFCFSDTHTRIYTHTHIYKLLELAHMIMEAETSRDLPSASWRTRKVSGVVQPEFQGLTTRSTDV